MARVEQAGGSGIVPELDDPSLLLERMDEGFYAIDRDWRFQCINRAAEAFWGLERSSMLGRSMLELFSKFEGSPAHAAHCRAMSGGEPVRVETISTATGQPVELKLFPSESGLSVYFSNISTRLQMEQDLRTRDELLTLAETSAGVGVWVADLKTGTVIATPQFYRLLGVDPVTGPVSQDLPRRYRHPDDRERVTRGFQEALASGADTYEVEYRIIRPSGEQRWIFGRGRVTRDGEGKPWRYSGVDIDITERKAREEHLRIVMRELLHRSNNLLAVIQGLARQTAQGSSDLDEFTQTFMSRLHGLSVSNALLARQEWRGAGLEDLLLAHVKPFGEQRFELHGPPAVLSPRAVQNVGLAVHELCTNAVKYGALSVPEGRVEVSWDVTPSQLRLRWKEIGGPPVQPPKRSGFGRVVAQQMLEAALGAEVGTNFASDGLEWTLALDGDHFTSGDAGGR